MPVLKSKILNKRDIDWTHKIILTDLKIDPRVLEMHRQRIDTIFASLPVEKRSQQLHNIILRDNLFSKAMDFILPCYDFEFNSEDVDEIAKGVIATYGDDKKDHANEIAKKMISKALIFNDLQKTYNIEITDEELMNILQDYYQNTNQPIRDFMEDSQKFNNAKHTLLEEKTIAFIIDKFEKDLSELEKKMQELINKNQQEQNNDK